MRGQSDQPQILEAADDYHPVLLRLMGDVGQARLSEVVAEFGRRWGSLIPPEHRARNESGDVRWQHYVRWARQHLVNGGLMGSGGHGVWTITEAGREWLREHPDGGKDELMALLRRDRAARRERAESAQESQRLSIRLGSETFTLSQADVLAAVRAALAGGVPPEAKRFSAWFLPVDGEPLSTKWVMSVATGLPTDRFITDDARRQLSKLGLEAQQVKPSEPARPEGPAREPELDREAFYRTVLAHLEGRLPAGIRSRRPSPRTNYLQLTCPAPNSHYELYLRREYTEIAIHFEGPRERNQALLDQFRPHADALKGLLGEAVYIELWGNNWAHVYLKRPLIRLDAPTAGALAADWLRFIQATLPVVEQAVADLGLRARRGRRPATVKDKDLERPQAILAEEIRRIRACLNGDQAFPGDEKLCDWVQFCYTFELFAEAVTLFRLVRPEAVNPWLYERTRKAARACELRS